MSDPKLNKKEFTLRNSNGFTLLEMMLVIVIISIMSVVVMNNYNSQKKTKEMQFAIQKISDDIRRVQNYSINIKKFEDYDISGGYGIHFERDGAGYIIFLNSPSVLNKAYVSGEDQIVETIVLSPSVTIETLNGVSDLPNADILFGPPYGKVNMTFNGTLQGSGATLEVKILRSPEGCPTFCRTVTVNSQGQIK
ncbi:MAG: type II secretion system protein [Candidatus Paceibacterota bacterium]|jgi:prepilin-type N-terminal cleavage/methylation domain-containing protein